MRATNDTRPGSRYDQRREQNTYFSLALIYKRTITIISNVRDIKYYLHIIVTSVHTSTLSVSL